MTLESERKRIQKWKDREKAKEFDTQRKKLAYNVSRVYAVAYSLT